jgi:DNA (cytosine-5)-methyltransferase 1
MTVGLKQAGFRVLGAIEVDPLAVETYRMNHPKVEIWPVDIRQVKVSEFKRVLGVSTGELDLLAACPPCEGFSSIRTLNGSRLINDPANDLVFQVIRFAKHLLPKTILIENVPALMADRRMMTILGLLAEYGYSTRSGVVDAADFSVPQRRERMFLMASRIGPMELPDAPTAFNPTTVRDKIGRLPEPKKVKTTSITSVDSAATIPRLLPGHIE